MSKPKTAEDVRAQLLSQFKGIADYWAALPDMTGSERCHGVVFSILATLDGSSDSMPSIDLLLSPHKDDKEYNISLGNDYYEKGMMINDCHLHELYKGN